MSLKTLRRNPFLVLAAALATAAIPGAPPAAPAPVQAPAPGQQDTKVVLPAQHVSRQAVKQFLGFYGMRHGGYGMAPWVDKHGYLLQQARRPVYRRSR